MPKYTIGDAPQKAPTYTIGDAPDTVTPTQGASIGAAQPEPWINQLEEDVRSGGARTLPGRILGYMQGRGNRGYSGLESGVSKGAADFAGSPELGALKWAQGVSELPTHPLEGLLHEGEGAWNASQIPMAFAGGPEADAAINAIPSRAHAVYVLNDIEQAGRNTPVYMENTEPALEKFGEHVATGGKNAKVMNLLRKRIEGAGDFAHAPIETPARPVAGYLEAPYIDIPMGETPTPGKMPGELVDAERFPATKVGEARVIRNKLGQILPKASRNVEFPESRPPARISPIRNERGVFVSSEGMTPEGPEEKPMLPIARNPNNGRMLSRVPTRRAWMAGTGEEMYPAQEFSGPGVLRRRMTFEAPEETVPEGEPINFPEARRFYTNVSDVTRRPGFLGRAFESSRNPRMRMMAGGVREGLHSDLTNSAQSLGRGEDYANAIKEYAQNAKLRGFLKKSGYALLPTAAGALGAEKAYRLAHAIGW